MGSINSKGCLGMKVDNILSFDIEDWFHPEIFDTRFRLEIWKKLESRVQRNTELILNFLSRKNLKATFFFLGWVAERCPHLVEDTHSDGHEIASHGYSHTILYRFSPSQFKEDLKLSLEILSSLSGKIKGYRAPTFSITYNTSLWALPILSDLGIKYDSSVYPTYHDRYGIPYAPSGPFIIFENGRDAIIEFPMSTIEFMKFKLPFGGGGYFRIYPLWLSLKLMRMCQKQNRPIIFYAHPWEFDLNNPRVDLPFIKRYRHYYGINKFLDRLDRITDQFKFTSFEKSNLWDLIDFTKRVGTVKTTLNTLIRY